MFSERFIVIAKQVESTIEVKPESCWLFVASTWLVMKQIGSEWKQSSSGVQIEMKAEFEQEAVIVCCWSKKPLSAAFQMKAL